MPNQQVQATTRKVRLNSTQIVKFKSNSISTGKYTFVTFIPKFLYEQFRKYANIFFLCIGLLQQIPGISPTGRWITIGPFGVILTITAIKEIYEDFKRHREDQKINESKSEVLKGTTWKSVSWKDVLVGDIVRVKSEKSFPADLILLASSDGESQCYIETANLDGETNLKIRSAHIGTKQLKEAQELADLQGELEAELPNKNLYDFTGNLTQEGKETQPIGPNEVLLRGSKLRNTAWICGLVVYTGAESKLMMNSTQAPLKASRVEKVTNIQIIFLFFILVAISLVSSGANQIQNGRLKNGKAHWYLEEEARRDDEATESFFFNFLTFFILYNNLIPISLMVSLELVRVFQAYFINCDEKMHYKDPEQNIDTYAVAKTSNLNEELGQIKYIFSDKTGTLTRNIMEFKKCSVAGNVYDTEDQMMGARDKKTDLGKEFLTLMSVCHTVVPEKGENGEVKFNAASPDEKALVEGVEQFGYAFVGKTSNSMTIRTNNNTEEVYEVLATIDFTSARKRMSILVRTPSGKIKLYIKGADNVILERVGKGKEERQHYDKTVQHLDTFARDGLRTLCLGVRDIGEQEYNDWSKKWRDASTTLTDREEAIDEAAKLIEKEVTLIGATAIEDKLQEHVPETIEKLLKAGIHVWMLTGDKQITAENIAKSCRLHTESAELLDLSDDVPKNIVTKITSRLKVLQSEGLEGQNNEITLIIDGKSLVHALEEQVKMDFVKLCTSCKAVICCRVSPRQKADMVELVSKFTKTITLAIGDGANDVAMIQKASVGVGVSGNEGLQAVNSADFSIGQFSYLLRLLLVHGAWNYARISNVILYSFYKNITLYVIELWFAIYSYWTGQVIYERWSIGMYNIFFTFFPPLALGIFDKTCNAETREKNPALYLISQNSELYNIKRFWMFICNALYHSVLLFWLCKWAMETGVLWQDGLSDGYLVLGNTVYTMVVITTCLKAALLMDSWNYISQLFIWGSIAVWFVYLISYSHFWPTIKFVASNMPRMYQLMFSSPVYWVLLIFVPVATIGVDFVIAYIKFQYLGSEADRLKRAEKKGTSGDPESTSQSNGGFQVASLMRQMRKRVTRVDNRSIVEPKGVVTTTTTASLPLEEMQTPERPARGVRRPDNPAKSEDSAKDALLSKPATQKSPSQSAREEFFKDLNPKQQTS